MFQMNFELETIHLPDGIEYIPFAFANCCLKLNDINIPTSVKQFKAYAFWQCRSLKHIELPPYLESIGTVALWYLDSLEEITFPATLKSVGAESCEYWASIKRIYSKSAEPPVCQESATNPGNTPFGSYSSTFYMRTPQDTPVYVPVGSADLYRNAWGWDYFTNFIETDFTGIQAIPQEEENGKKAIYDLQGRKVTHPIPNQLYIVNEKNV